MVEIGYDEARRQSARPGLARHALAVRSNKPTGAELLRSHVDGAAALTPAVILSLQRSAGNRAVTGALASRSAGLIAIQRVATNLIAGLKEDDPSSYDAGGGHSYKDHGAQTTKEQHVNRVKTGVAPSGRVSKVPKGKGSSKFVSDAKHKEAATAAFAALRTKNEPLKAVKGQAGPIPLAGAGPIYYADNSEDSCDQVQLDILPVDDTTVKINSMYPVK
jgi:hypothetical protein